MLSSGNNKIGYIKVNSKSIVIALATGIFFWGWMSTRGSRILDVAFDCNVGSHVCLRRLRNLSININVKLYFSEILCTLWKTWICLGLCSKPLKTFKIFSEIFPPHSKIIYLMVFGAKPPDIRKFFQMLTKPNGKLNCLKIFLMPEEIMKQF